MKLLSKLHHAECVIFFRFRWRFFLGVVLVDWMDHVLVAAATDHCDELTAQIIPEVCEHDEVEPRVGIAEHVDESLDDAVVLEVDASPEDVELEDHWHHCADGEEDHQDDQHTNSL